jgi:hypothetical protein
MKFCNAPNCNNPVFGKGFCRNHQYKREDFDKRSIVQKAIAKHKEKKQFIAPERLDKVFENVINAIEPQWEWFKERRKLMTGICQHCGGKTCKDDDAKFHYSIAHVLPKAYFKSIATHHENWIELCYYGNSCHSNYDSHMIDLTELNCWSSVIDKFIAMYPSIDKSERRRIPNVLLQYINTEL